MIWLLGPEERNLPGLSLLHRSSFTLPENLCWLFEPTIWFWLSVSASSESPWEKEMLLEDEGRLLGTGAPFPNHKSLSPSTRYASGHLLDGVWV